MIPGDLISKIDKIWETFWIGILSNSIAAIEKMTYFILNCMMDELQTQKSFEFFKPDTIGDNVCIPPHLVSSHLLHEDQLIRVEVEEYNDNRTGDIKLRVKRIEIV